MSMRELYFSTQLEFSTPDEQRASEQVLLRAMGLVAQINLNYLEKFPLTPLLYDSGVLYTPPDQADGRPSLRNRDIKALIALLQKMGASPETAAMVVRVLRGVEVFMSTPELYRRGKGDCNELVPVRLAELWRAGIIASPYLTKSPMRNEKGGISYHAIVHYPDGSAEDPSLILGMGGLERADDRKEEIRKNLERVENAMAEGRGLEQIAAMGFVPTSGVFKSPYEKTA